MDRYEIRTAPPGVNKEYKIYSHCLGLLYYIGDVDEADFTEERLSGILNLLEGQLLLATRESMDSFQVKCISHTSSTRAIEIIDFVFGAYGVIKGNANYAEGRMSLTMLSMCMSEAEITTVTQYMMHASDQYFGEIRNIYAHTFAAENKEYVDSMKLYEKKPVSWAFVKSTDIAKPGTLISIKSLENEAGVRITANEDIYIMIGVKGEVYEITKEKFMYSYVESDEQLDIFESYFDFIPSVELPDTGEYMVIDEMAHLCYPQPGVGIKADRLTARTKVFRTGKPDYFIGKPGDYLAIRPDDLTDIYIIQNEVFGRTYEEKKTT